MSFVTAVWLSRVLIGLLVKSGYFNNPAWFGISRKRQHKLEENIGTLDLSTKFDRLDFVHHRKKFYSISMVILVVGLVILAVFKLNLGIDFSSGTRVEIQADQKLTQDEVTSFLTKVGFENDSVVISGDKSNVAVMRYTDDFSQKEILEFKDKVLDEYGHEPNISTVSPTVGKELVKNAIKALIIAAIGIIIYVAIRFEWRMGLGAIVSLLHDVFFMIAIFSLLRIEVDITFVAAVLTCVEHTGQK